MRNDLSGLWWNDTKEVRVPKPKIVRVPPDPVWLKDDYLPNLFEARAEQWPKFGPGELAHAARCGETLIFDEELAPNYFLIGFMSLQSGKVVHYEIDCELFDEFTAEECAGIKWLLENFKIAGFNSKEYDVPLLTFALEGYTVEQLKEISDRIIQMGERGYDMLRANRVKKLQINHVDLLPVAPLMPSLKKCAGRLHAPRMQDLPFSPHKALSLEQKAIVKWYNVNDLINTAHVYIALRDMLKLRESITARYGVDVRSKSDPQVAEAIVQKRIESLTGQRMASKVEIDINRIYYYKAPPWMQFATPLMQYAFEVVKSTPLVVAPSGRIPLPVEIANLDICIGNSSYQMGVGGLHSKEKSKIYRADEDTLIKDFDVASYYPKIIANTEIYPAHIGPLFLTVYKDILNQRLAAKARKDTAEAESLKIALNGIFGKFTEPFSRVYDPSCGIQTTITGQLTLLMFIEAIELIGLRVISANTDGVIVVCPKTREALLSELVKAWEKVTSFELEETKYLLIASRDVNNYMALKTDGKWKSLGAYKNPWANPHDGKEGIMRFHKNPVNTICIEAAQAFLQFGCAPLDVIRECKDIRKFLTVRHVNGGGVKNGIYLGKDIRWYYAAGEVDPIVYAKSGNFVPRSEGARPLMTLPAILPDDINYDWYEAECFSILVDLGVYESNPKDSNRKAAEET